ncbi:MAG: phenylalanine--tRNA ligase subunit beta [Candidatus Eisenbacteria bacterium]|nr:phenylalanine--tRNA ligase subunit beta [Candidatus Eisenbacteria bacterium]
MPVVAIPTDALRRRIGAPVDDDTLMHLLERLGCDVEGFAPVRRLRCPSCGSIVERTEKGEPPGACPECLADAGGDPEKYWIDLGWENAIRMDLLPVRPDLFDAGGLARALRGLLGRETGLPRYDLAPASLEVRVDPDMGRSDSYRPYIACAAVRGVRLDDFTIRAVMKLQEDLHWALGRNRKFASIGVYDLSVLEGPFLYRPVGPEEIRFVPLASRDDRALTPREILEKHPKGIDYAHLLKEHARYPLLEDARGKVLSIPPVINSKETAIHAGSTDLFIDVTGIEERPVEKALHVLTTSFLELFEEARPEKVAIVRGGERRETPDLTPAEMRLDPREAERVIGVPLDAARTAKLLRAMRHDAEPEGDMVRAVVPAYRNDILHPVDLIEDVAMAIGYDEIPRRLIPSFTLAGERPERVLQRRARETMLGLGFSEAMSLMLTNEKDLYERTRSADPGDAVRAENPASVEQRILRTALAPGLLRLLGRNRGAGVTHRLFEADDVVLLAEGHDEPEERLHLAGVIQDRTAGFADIRSVADAAARELGIPLAYRPSRDPLFLEGRGAELLAENRVIGRAGEVHPEVLENYSIAAPAAIFEIELDRSR